MMKLYHSPTSPFVRKVMVVLHETSQTEAVTIRTVTNAPTGPDPSVATQNPLGKIPVLSRPDGPALYDSRVICRYLDHRAGAGLYPEGTLWEVLTLESLADGILDATVAMFYEGRFRPEGERSPGWVEAQWRKVAQGLDALEERWLSHLTGGQLHMGQIGVGCALAYLDLRMSERDWRAGRPGLTRWTERFAARPAMTATAPP